MSETLIPWIAVLLRSSVVVLLGLGIASTLRGLRLTADARHRIWQSVFLILALLPIFGLMLPSIDLPLSYAGLGFAVPTLSTPGTHLPNRDLSDGLRATYAAGAGLLLLRFAWGQRSLAVLWRNARRLTIPESDATARLAGVIGPVEVRVSPLPIAPLTWGRRILLPSTSQWWSEERLRHVLLHEFSHIARWDGAMQVVATLVRALLWFSPPVWFALHRLRSEQEHACDEAVIALRIDPNSYARSLLEIAADSGFRAVHGSTGAVARRSTLTRRIESILQPRATRQAGRAQLAAWILLLLLAGGAVSATSPFDVDRVLPPLNPLLPATPEGFRETLDPSAQIGMVRVPNHDPDVVINPVPGR